MSIKLSVCVSRKSTDGTFASCGLSEIEIDPSLLGDAEGLAAEIRGAYRVVTAAVDRQLGEPRAAALPPAPAVGNVATPPAPAPAPPIANGTDDRPPTSARSLGGWAKRRGVVKWFSDLGKANKRSGLISEWDDQFAVWAYQQWLTQDEAQRAPSRNNH